MRILKRKLFIFKEFGWKIGLENVIPIKIQAIYNIILGRGVIYKMIFEGVNIPHQPGKAFVSKCEFWGDNRIGYNPALSTKYSHS